MKRCSECRRDYYDDTLLFCLDDGAALLEGPAATAETKTRRLGATNLNDEPQTAILNNPSSEARAKYQIRETEKTAVLPKAEFENPPKTHTASTRNTVIAGIIGIVLVTVLGIGSYWLYGTRANKQIGSIAVMPFVNESGNSDVEYLSDGMTETLISNLSNLPNLNVKPRSSVFRYKGKEADPQTVGKELNVQAILNGRVIQRGQDISLFIELIDISLDKVVWSETYNRKQADLVTLQTDIARDVSGKIKTKLSGEDIAKVTKTYTTNPEAYQLYLKGRYQLAKRTKDDVKRGIESFQQASKLDSNFALAFVGVSDSYLVMPSYAYLSPKEAVPLARTAAQHALTIDPTLAEAHSALANTFALYDWNWAEAAREYKRALELNPNVAEIHHRYGLLYLAPMGRLDEAAAELKRALELEPLSLSMGANLAFIYMLARQYKPALEQAQKTYNLEPNQTTARRLGVIYNANGMYNEAIALSEKFLQTDPANQYMLSIAGYTYAKTGRRGDAEAVIKKLKEIEKTQYVISYFYVVIYAALDDKDQAVAELEKAYEQRDYFMPTLKIDPFVDSLREDSRFKEILKRMNFPE